MLRPLRRFGGSENLVGRIATRPGPAQRLTPMLSDTDLSRILRSLECDRGERGRLWRPRDIYARACCTTCGRAVVVHRDSTPRAFLRAHRCGHSRGSGNCGCDFIACVPCAAWRAARRAT